MFWKKHKTLKAIWAVLGHLKPKKFLCRPTMVTDIFSKILPPPPPPPLPPATLELLQPWGLKKQLWQL